MNEDKLKKRMDEVIDLITTDIASIRTGRASSSMVTEIEVSAYGGQQRLKINELANVSSPDPETIVIEPWDKSIIGDIKKGIEEANVGLNPSIDGEIIRISVPPMTTEDRQKYVKLLGEKLENAKIMIRQIRGDVLKVIREAFDDKNISEDEKFTQEKRLQEITDQYTKKIEEMGEKKEKELMNF